MRTRRLDHAPLLVALLCSITFACSRTGFGQTSAGTSTDQATAAGKYAGESIVIERSDNIYSMAADGTGWRQQTIAVKVQSDAAVRQLGVIGIPFAGSSERVEIQYARVRRPDGSVVETPVTDALEMPDEVTRAAPFYSDLKQKQLPIRNLRVGDTLEWQAKIVRTKAEAPGQFWGADNFLEDGVVLEQTIELRVPVSKAVKVWSPGHKPVESVAGNERVLPVGGVADEAYDRARGGSEEEGDLDAGTGAGCEGREVPGDRLDDVFKLGGRGFVVSRA